MGQELTKSNQTLLEFAELIETGMASGEDIVRFSRGIHQNAQRLLTLINDIIRLSELDDSQEELATERLNLYELAATCVEMLSVSAEKHQVRLQMDGSDSYVLGDRMMLEELLYNLCDNAIRYNNEKGQVQVQVQQKGDQVILMVRDTGIGIPKEHQDRIFERFYRVDKSRSKSTGGTGLGLAIVKHIIARHHAEAPFRDGSFQLRIYLSSADVSTTAFSAAASSAASPEEGSGSVMTTLQIRF